MIRLLILGYKGHFALTHLKDCYLDLIEDVVIAKDEAVQEDYYNINVELCRHKGLKFYERGQEPHASSEYWVMIGWRWMVKSDAKLIIVHDSLLPKYRGFNPLVTALINGDTTIGATCLFGTDDYDRGEVIIQKKTEISYPIKINEAIVVISRLYSQILNDLCGQIASGSIVSFKQSEEDATYSLWRDSEDYFIDWNRPADEIKRFIDAVGFPYQGAKTILENCALRIDNALIVEDIRIANRQPGKVIFKDTEGLTIVCGTGLLKIKDFYFDNGSLFDYSKKFRLRFTS